MQNFALHYRGGEVNINERTDTFDAVDTEDSAVRSKLHRDLPVLERKPTTEETYRECNMSKFKCPPTLVSHIRQQHKTTTSSRYSSGSRYQIPIDYIMYRGDTGGDSCASNKFDLSSAQSIVRSIANPCSPSIPTVTSVTEGGGGEEEEDNDGANSLVKSTSSSRRRSKHSPGTLPTSCSSSASDDDDNSLDCTERDTTYPVVRTSTVKPSKGKSHKDYVDDGTDVFLSYRSSLPTSRQVILVLVGNDYYQLTNTTTRCIVKRLNDQSILPRDKKAIIDMSCHSLEEWNIVMEFLQPSLESREKLSWSTLPILLPWLVELRVLQLTAEIDLFLLHNILGGRSDGTVRPIHLVTMLQLSKIAYSCGLESTKTQVRRFLRHSLLHPKKITSSISSNVSGQEEEFELDWSLDDLKVLAELMTIFDECREYLWEYAVITYLPHDLDISDSWGLVSNPLFPYLLREGMMQMIILESMETSFYSENASSSNRPTQTNNNNKSFSDVTTSSDTTIPTCPTKRLSQKEVEYNLLEIIRQLEKFQSEKDTPDTEYYCLEDTSTKKIFDHHEAANSRSDHNSSQRRNRQPNLPTSQERFAC